MRAHLGPGLRAGQSRESGAQLENSHADGDSLREGKEWDPENQTLPRTRGFSWGAGGTRLKVPPHLLTAPTSLTNGRQSPWTDARARCPWESRSPLWAPRLPGA